MNIVGGRLGERMNIETGKVAVWVATLTVLAIVAYIAIESPIRPLAGSDSAVTPPEPENAIGLEQALSSRESGAKTNSQDARQTSDCAIVYYFHTTARCGPCIKMEEWTKEAVLSGFPDATKAGRLAWQVINVEKPENDHFIDDYGLIDMSVVVAQRRAGETSRYKILENTWSLLDDKLAFFKYVQDEVGEYLLGRDL